jgi:hypothetical protein
LQKCKIITGNSFEKELKQLGKRHASIKNDVAKLILTLQENPRSGTPLGGEIYKIRLAIKSKGRGKSGGARIITYYLSKDNELFLLSIYDKSEQGTISDKKIAQLLQQVLIERRIL